MEQSLQSAESLDRASPELWPEKGDYAACAELLCQDSNSNGASGARPTAAISPVLITDQDFTQQDMKLFHEYASLRPEQLVDVVKQLQNVAYLLGLEEAKEMRRGKYLNILVRKR
ncbi:Protein lin-52 [Amphibalanus amphitrite]|uniref:Protein lin-52 n=2 Tax=Amphibalanus amphitrite TaxID=1232801 RepID=A0A6A4VHI3_AMPAM|nr:Protein lin-52 [Amphibalanus amphitrite]